jgi:hypothetical protein
LCATRVGHTEEGKTKNKMLKVKAGEVEVEKICRSTKLDEKYISCSKNAASISCSISFTDESTAYKHGALFINHQHTHTNHFAQVGLSQQDPF